MAAISQTTYSNAISYTKHEKLCVLIQISLEFVSKGPIDKKSALGQ